MAQDEVISCDFETDFCGFTPNEFVVRYQGKSPSATSGPTYDHTYGMMSKYNFTLANNHFNNLVKYNSNKIR